MGRAFENLKSLILTILIFSSLVLTGSLWFDNYQGLSLLVSSIHNNMIDKFTNDKEISIVYDKIITPYKVTVINPDKNKWIFYETNSVHQSAWNIVKTRLNSLNSDSEIITGKVKEWDGLFSRKSIVLEFGGSIHYDVLRLAIPNLPKETNAFNNVEKIAITKSLEGNTMYILQNDSGKKSLYKVLFKGDDDELETFMENCENMKSPVKYLELEKVGTTSFFGNKEVIPQSGVLFPVSNINNHKEAVKQLRTSPHFDIEDEYTINRFLVDIFNNTDFAKFITNDESKIFINDDKSSIKFEKNGMVEYINNAKQVEEVVSASKNFNAAINFINSMRVYDDIYLFSANEKDGIYTFTFSIAVDGVLIGMNDEVICDDNHAIIEIQVSEGNVKYFKGKLLKLELLENERYISNFTHNILDEVLSKVNNDTKTNIYSIELMYIVDKAGTYYPNWVVRYGEKKTDELKNAIIYVLKK